MLQSRGRASARGKQRYRQVGQSACRGYLSRLCPAVVAADEKRGPMRVLAQAIEGLQRGPDSRSRTDRATAARRLPTLPRVLQPRSRLLSSVRFAGGGFRTAVQALERVIPPRVGQTESG